MVASHTQEQPIFVFNLDDIIFERETQGKPNFISVYYLEFGDSSDDLLDYVDGEGSSFKMTRYVTQGYSTNLVYSSSDYKSVDINIHVYIY